ncbi:Ribokinase-like protein [Polychytrium aggregatum]|uniref:Ribokinase-like protein n=1 Tax=Polychytrium aggregatum TaxID=110093 RepID=UPI0022FE92A5|nr:Ribokinase-like protein [Polychytrium aggregatum]KAI9190727.1 Ribokinase-like protein [Polychytrium aggregatum]
MSSEYVLLGIENPLLDISAVVKPEFLSKYDLLANNAILAEDKHKPLYAEFVGSYPVEYGAGGAAQNSLRGAQWLLPKNSTVYIGCVGKDAQGALLKEAAAKDGLRTEYLEDETLPTGQCAVLITDHNRSLVTDLQAANAYKIDHLKRPEVWSLVEKARFFYVGGYFLTVSPPSALLIAEHAAQTSKVFTLNLSAPFISQFFTEPLDSLIPYVDILFGNESEAAAFADAHNFGTHDLAEVGLKIAALPKKNGTRARTVVFTHGAKSTVVIHNGKATEYPIIPIAADKIVDTNGAGDAFVGGFLSQLVQGHSLERSVAAGHYLANVIIQRNGSSIPRESHSFKF